jgi:hypothetical protein
VALTAHPHLTPRLSINRSIHLLPLCAFGGLSGGELYLCKIYKENFYAQHGAEENKVNNGTDSGYVVTLFEWLRSDRMTVGVMNSKETARKW